MDGYHLWIGAVRTLANLAGADAVPLLAAKLQVARGEAQEDIAWELSCLGDRRAVPALLAVVEQAGDGWAALAATEALGALGCDEAAIGPLERRLARRLPQENAPCSRALEGVGTPEALAAAGRWRVPPGTSPWFA